MGRLHLYRVSPTLPFQNVSVDFVGPFTRDATANFTTQTIS